MSLNDDIRFMQQALRVATEKGSDPAVSPIGCVIVMDGQIIASQHNHVAEKHDAMAHAEIESMREAGRGFENGELRGETLYSTLQPCVRRSCLEGRPDAAGLAGRPMRHDR